MIPDNQQSVNNNRFLAIALKEIRQGRAVFPCIGKIPAIDGGKGCQDATTDEKQIYAWAKKYPDANVGLTAKNDGKEVYIDVDTDNLDKFRDLLKANGIDNLNTRTVRTGGGGLHLYFQRPQGVTLRNISKKEGLGFELKSHNQYIMAAGSVHPDTGKIYELISDMQPQPTPEFLIKIASNGSRSRNPITKLQSGSRHNSLISDIGKLRQAGTPEDVIEKTALTLNAESSDPLPDAEVIKMVKEYQSQSKVNEDGSPKTYNQSDTGNAEFFAHEYGDILRFDHKRGRWLVWHKHYWKPDPDQLIYRLAIKAMRKRYQEAVNIQDLKERNLESKWATGSEQKPKIEAMLGIAKALKPIADTGEDWDTNPWLFGVKNGVIDLKTSEFRAGEQSDRITLQSDIDYEPTATAPRWLQFLNEVFNNDNQVIDWLQRYFGYALTGDTSEQKYALGFGNGANGKGTLIRALKKPFGDYAYSAPFSTFELFQRQGIPNDLAALLGKRFVTASETNSATRLNEARIKALTGQDTITARFLHAEFFSFEPVAKYFFAVNDKPIVDDDSYGFWRRIRLIPFIRQFSGREVDRKLDATLASEAPGILNWLIQGCLRWQAQGLDDTPEAMESATTQYKADSDDLSSFLADECQVHPKAQIQAARLYKAYKSWCIGQGYQDKEILTNTKFGRSISKRFDRIHKTGGATYLGVSLKNDGLADGFRLDVSQNKVNSLENSLTRENIQQPVNPSVYAQQPVISEADGLNVNPSKPVSQPQNEPNELPDCLVCGANDWNVSPKDFTKFICPCGNEINI